MKFNLNLASRSYLNRRAVATIFMASIFLLLLVAGWEVSQLNSKNESYNLTQQRLQAINLELQEILGAPREPLSVVDRAALDAEYLVIGDLLSHDAFRWTELLDRIEKLIPKGVSLNGFQPDYNKKSLTLSGRAVNLKNMRTFLDRLIKNSSFEQVYIENHSRIKVRDFEDKEHSAISFAFKIEGVF